MSLRSSLTFVLTTALAANALAEDAPRAKVSASTQGGYARLLFDWPVQATGSAELSSGVLVISFDKSFPADVDALSRTLEPYAALVRADPDGRALRIALKGPVRLKSAIVGSRYAFDLIPPSFSGDPPPPAPPANVVQGPPTLTVRATEREQITRLQLDFPGKAAYTAKLEGGKLRVTFAKDARVDLKRFTEAPPSWVRGARSYSADGKLTVEFDVDAEADFRDASTGDRIVLELSNPKSDGQAIVTPGAPKVLIPQVVVEEIVPPPPKLVSETISFALPPRKSAMAATAAAPVLPPAAEPKLQPTPVAYSDAAAVQAAGSAPAVDDETIVSADPSPLPPTLRLGQSDLGAALAPAPPIAPATPGQARAEIYGSMVRIELPYTKLPAAAVFRRGLAIWVVVATAEGMDLSALGQLPNSPLRVLSAPTQVTPGVTAFRLEAPGSMTVSAAAAGNSWVLAVGNTVPDVPAQLQLVRQTVGPKTQLRAFLPGITQVVWIKDPQAEDRIAVVLSYAPARGLASGRSFVEFAALPSQQGLAVQAVADDLSVAVEGSEAVITRPVGLSISDAAVAKASTTWVPVTTGGESPAFVDFVAWGKPVAETRAEAVRKLMRLSSESPGGMSPPRMTLARYYIAEGFAAEALGVLANIAREDRTSEANPQFRVARAVANIQMGRYRDALTELSMESLGNDPHAAMWRGLAAAGARDWRTARSSLMAALRIVNRYPPKWEGRARVDLARAALALNEPASAMQALAGMPRHVLPADVMADATVVRAALEVVAGKPDAAIALYDQAAASPYKPAAARARLEGTVLKAAKGKLGPAEAIDALERLRFQWRGDDIELETLRQLGKLYVENNRIRDGLNTMRLAVRHFSATDDARATATQMAKIFEGLFLEGKADNLPPVQALALFYDFRELTPAGAQGDEMIRRLAERLVTVDLLPQAAELLQHQVDNRLDGIAKASVATKLALIYLLDRKAEKALAVIRTTKQTRLPDDLIGQRNLIEARALADLKMYDAALDTIAADLSPEGERLRADVLWDAQRWGDAAARAEELLAARYQDLTPLNEIERSDLMRATVAYSLAGDAMSVERLRTRFGPKMSQSPDAKAFALLTQSPDVTDDDYKNVVKRVASVDTLDAFLAEFKSKHSSASAPAAAPAPTTH